MSLSIEQLEAFVTTSEAGSFSAAARRLGKVQSAISTAVSNLEIDLGVTLFDRTGKYPLLTDEGDVLLRDAQTILARCNALQDRAFSLTEAVDARLRIAMDEIIPHAFLVTKLEQFAEQFPHTEIEVLYGALSDIQTMVTEKRVDMGLLVPFDFPGKSVTAKFLSHMHFCPVVAPHHPLALLNEVLSTDLEPYRQIGITSRGGEREPDTQVYANHVWTTESNETIRDLIIKGLGYSFLPVHLIQEDLVTGRLVRLPLIQDNAQSQAPIYLIWASGRSFGKAGKWLMEAFTQL